MSLSKKRAAPKPPLNPDLPIVQNKENVIAAENGNGREQVKPKADDKVPLKIVFPNQTTEDITIAPDTQLIDLRTRLCTQYKLSAGEHKLEPVDENGRAIQFTPSSTIGSISAKAVHLKTKAKEPVKVAPPKVVEQSVRLVIKMSATKQQILRVRPNEPLVKLRPQILEKFGLKQADYEHIELRHPQQTTMRLDTTRTLDDYKIREIFVADRRAGTGAEGKISRGGNEKTSKKIKKFFGLSKKRKTTDPVSPAPVFSPTVANSKPEEHANSNDNNSTKREETPKKKRPAPHQPQNEPLHGQVEEKMEEPPPETTEDHQKPVETEVNEDVEDVKEIPSSPPARPTAPPRQKVPVAAVRAGKKKAPAPPSRTSVPTPSADEQSSIERSKPEKPPRRQSAEPQKSPEQVSIDGTDDRPESERGGDDSGSEDGAVEIEIPLVASRPDSPEVEEEVKQIQENIDDNIGEAEDLEPQEIPSTFQEREESPLPSPPPPEEPERMEEEDFGFPTQSDQSPTLRPPDVIPDASTSQPVEPSPPSLTQPISVASEKIQDEEEESLPGSPDAPVQEDEKEEESGEDTTVFPPPIEPLDTSDISPALERREIEITKVEREDEDLQPSSPDSVEGFEFLPAAGEDVPPPEDEETKYKELPPPVDYAPDEFDQETFAEHEQAPPEVEEMLSQHDVEYKPEDVITVDHTMDVPETFPEPKMKVSEPVLDDADNLFTTPADYNVYEVKRKDDIASMEAKALEMLKQFTLPAGGNEEPAVEDTAGRDFPPPSADILDNIVLPELDQQTEQKVSEEPEEKSDEQTMQEIERLKEQINIMRRKKAKKEAEEEEAKKNPYTIVAEANAVNDDPVKYQGKSAKTFTFVPNPRAKKRYEDYEAAPEVAINLSQSGEIKGMGIVQLERSTEVKVKTPENMSSPRSSTPTSPRSLASPTIQDMPPLKTPEVVVIEEGRKAPISTETQKLPTSPSESVSSEKSGDSTSKPVNSVTKPKASGGYVSSAIMRQPTAAATAQNPGSSTPAQTYTPALYGNGETSKRSSLPNYYRRFLKMEVDAAIEEDDKSPPKKSTSPPKTAVDKQKLEAALSKKLQPKSLPIGKSPYEPGAVPNGSATTAKSPPAVAEKPKFAQKINEILISPQIETLPSPLEESKSSKSSVDDIPLPPPPEEFLTPSKKEVPDVSLPLTTNTYQSPSVTSPTKATSPGRTTNIVGISAAKPFGSAGGNKFRRMSAAFKSGKAGKLNSP